METLPWARLGKIWEHLTLFETKLPQNSHRQIESLSWYRLGNIEEHLPALRSVQRDMNHIHIRYIGPREYQPTDPITSPTELPHHIEPEQDKSNVERVAGGHIPIPLEGQRFYPAAMTRHSAAARFDGDKSKPWKTGIILLDPPFESKQQNYGERQNSEYRSFISRPMSPAFDGNKNLDSRDTYLSSLVHCLDWNPALRVDAVPGPLVILQDLYCIIASEWIAVNAYVERDLNTIEYRLEHEKGHLDGFESFLKRLFIMRHRTQKFENLVNEQLQL